MALKTEARRQKILEAALCEFEARGHAAARMEDIARAAGVAKERSTTISTTSARSSRGSPKASSADSSPASRILFPKARRCAHAWSTSWAPSSTRTRTVPSSRTIRVIWSEGLHDPTLTAPFFTEMLLPQLSPEGPLFEAMAKADLPDAFRRHPQMVLAPFMQAILWQSLLRGREATQHARLHGRLVLAGASRKEGGRRESEGRVTLRRQGSAGSVGSACSAGPTGISSTAMSQSSTPSSQMGSG